jgi:hypothetical protein
MNFQGQAKASPSLAEALAIIAENIYLGLVDGSHHWYLFRPRRLLQSSALLSVSPTDVVNSAYFDLVDCYSPRHS